MKEKTRLSFSYTCTYIICFIPPTIAFQLRSVRQRNFTLKCLWEVVCVLKHKTVFGVCLMQLMLVKAAHCSVLSGIQFNTILRDLKDTQSVIFLSKC